MKEYITIYEIILVKIYLANIIEVNHSILTDSGFILPTDGS